MGAVGDDRREKGSLPSEDGEAVARCLSLLPTGVQMAIAIVEDGKARFLGAERTERGVDWIENRTTVFEIGSITKAFTATLLCQAAHRGEVG